MASGAGLPAVRGIRVSLVNTQRDLHVLRLVTHAARGQASAPADELVERFGALGEAGAQHVLISVRGVSDVTKLQRLGAEVLPQLR